MKFLLTLLFVLYVVFQFTKYFCFTENRYLSDREFIEPDLKAGIESGEILTHSWDNTVDSYLKYHPNCCTVSKNTFWHDIFFDNEVVVTLKYELSGNRKELGGRGEHYIYIGFKDACGHTFESTGFDD
jgi:hypothetical protein